MNVINSDKSQEKWLIFINSKLNAQKFAEKIKLDNVVFITSESKNSKNNDGKIYSQIVNEQKFNCKILICTSVLDNGINIKDDLLKHLVIFSYDKTEFIQILGRKRIIKDNEKVNLYLYAGNIHEVSSKLLVVKRQLQFINELKKNPVKFLNSDSRNEIYKGIFFFSHNLKLIFNPLAEKKLWYNKAFYEKILLEFNNSKEAFILEQLSWIGLEKTYDCHLYLTYIDPNENKAKFIEFLNDNCDISLSGEELAAFQKKFKSLCVNIYGEQEGDRTDRFYKVTKMRKIFKKYNLPYVIEVKNRIYTLSNVIN